MKLKKAKRGDKENEMKLTSTLKEHTRSYKGPAEENEVELRLKNEISEEDFNVSPLAKK